MLSSLARLAPYAWGSGRAQFRLSCYVFCLVAAAFAATSTPLLFRRVVDDGLAAGQPTVGLAWAVAAFAVALVAAGATASAGWLGAWVGQDLTYRLRIDLYRRICRQPVAFFAQSRSGALASRISGDALDVQGLVQSVLGTLAGQGLTFAFAVAAMVVLDPLATVVALAAAPLFLLPIRPFGRRLRIGGNRQAEARSLVQHHLSEQLNVEAAQAREIFGAHEHDLRLFQAAAADMRSAVVTRNANFYASSFFLAGLGAFGVASVYGIACISGDRGISIGTVVALAGLVGLMYQPLTQIATQGIGLGPSLVALERVYEVIDHGQPAQLGTHIVDRPVQCLRLEKVWFRHPGPEATLPSLRSDQTPPDEETSPTTSNGWKSTTTDDQEWTIKDLSLDLRAGTTALVGATGAGKTTTALLACGVHQPSRGHVYLDGTELHQIDESVRHATIAVLTQDPFVVHASVRENLRLAAPDAQDSHLVEALRQAQLLETIQAMPDQIVVLAGGRIVERGTHDQLVHTNGVYAGMVQSATPGKTDGQPSLGTGRLETSADPL